MITYEFNNCIFHAVPKVLGITAQDEEAIAAAKYPVADFNVVMDRLSKRIIEFYHMPTQGSC